MKRYLPWIVAGLAALWFVAGFVPPRGAQLRSREFASLPVLLNGRIQPLDSVARNALLQLRTKQSVRVPAGKDGTPAVTLSAIDWLKEAMFKPELADTRPVFRIDHPEVIALLKIRSEDKHFSYNDIHEGLGALEREAQRINDSDLKPEQLTPFQKAVRTTYERVVLYHRLKNSLKPERINDLSAELAAFEKALPPGKAAAEAERAGQPFAKADLDALMQRMTAYENVSRYAYPLMVPGVAAGHSKDDWKNVGDALMEAARTEKIPEPIRFYATMNDAYRSGNDVNFEKAVSEFRSWLVGHDYIRELQKGGREEMFNNVQSFYKAMSMYVLAFLLAAISWFNRNETLRRTGVGLIWVALVLHSVGLIWRMVLEGRPPVTNLYSSAVFIGWGAAIFGLGLERFYKDGIGTVTAGLVGFTTLVIAHNLSTSGDTMQMLVAVLDTNFWLATHVVVVTLGYSATFVAGFLAVLYIFRGFFTTSLTAEGARGLTRMVYGVVCFATLFSFVGTVLGGIWADQSWGRFWGWDPKENGALMIVIWNAFYLHARWGRLFAEKTMMAIAVIGNIITAFSWFGVNMLGIGLHSYGFMDSAFLWLIAFDICQLLIVGLALLPLRYWRSHKNLLAPAPSTGGKGRKPSDLVPKPA